MKKLKIKDKELYKTTVLSHLLPIKSTPNLNFIVPSLDYDAKTFDEDDKTVNELSMIVNMNSYRIQDNHKIIFAGLNSEARNDLTQKWNIDVDTRVQSALVGEMKNAMVKEYLKKVKILADMTPPLYIGFVQKFMGWIYSVFNKIYRPLLKVKDDQKFVYLLMTYSNIIAHSTRRGPATFAIISSKMASMLKDDSKFVFSDFVFSDDNETLTNLLYSAGTIAGLTIYVDGGQSLKDNTVIIGKSNLNTTDPGLFLGYKKYATKIVEVPSDNGNNDFVITPKYAIVEYGKDPELMFRKILVTY